MGDESLPLCGPSPQPTPGPQARDSASGDLSLKCCLSSRQRDLWQDLGGQHQVQH